MSIKNQHPCPHQCALQTFGSWQEPEKMRAHLRMLLHSFLITEDPVPIEEREEVYFTYQLIDDALRQIPG